MEHIKKFNENSENNKYFLIVYTESSDEIHFIVMDYSFYNDVINYISGDTNNSKSIDNILKIIYDNEIEHLFCQTWVIEDFTKINKYNIVECIHLPILGC